MACIMALWCRFEKAAATSMDRMALLVSWSRRACVSLRSSSAPEGRPMAYWCGLRVVAMLGVMCLVIAAAMILRGMVPRAIGRMRPLGLSSGMTLA